MTTLGFFQFSEKPCRRVSVLIDCAACAIPVSSSPIKPSSLWSACRKHMQPDIARRAIYFR